ncbi:unnamed protein product [Eruca vesicaria subsp. sativa]|uniref:Pentatricopeptide repeat-containing protein n=1 Tax=Eruca vesicaria subsp. sativa TaxID=29727 RepID=A0ABC8M9I2_ERUVS|nr:unnamed protein product [Eruca vesicaria subsp. sativa]
MALLRRILHLRPLFSSRQITSSTAVPYPLGRRDPQSLPSALTKEIDPNQVFMDNRPISIGYRVATALQLSQLDRAAEISRYVYYEHKMFIANVLVPCNTIIDAMCRAKRYEDAIALFHYFFNKSKIVPNTLSFNLIIKAHCDEGRVDDALELYRYFTPDSDKHRLLAQGLVDSGRIHEALCLAAGFDCVDWKVHDVLIRGFLNLGNHDMARQLFSQVKDAEGIAFVSSTFLDYWFDQGDEEQAALYLPSKVEYLLSGNKLLQVLFKHGQTSFRWQYFKGMLQQGLFDSETINIGVNEYFKQGKFGQALETFKRSPLSGSYSNIIARLCERGMVSEAESLLEEMTSPDVADFRALINAYIRAGRVDDSLRIYTKMVVACVRKVAIHYAP